MKYVEVDTEDFKDTLRGNDMRTADIWGCENKMWDGWVVEAVRAERRHREEYQRVSSVVQFGLDYWLRHNIPVIARQEGRIGILRGI